MDDKEFLEQLKEICVNNGQPQANGMCIDCFADEFGKIVEKYPIFSTLIRE